jgi:uncharacterized protein
LFHLKGIAMSATAEIAGLPWQKLPPSTVMSVEDMVDAALVGLDQGELVTIPGLHDGDEWTRFEAAAVPSPGASAVPSPRPATGTRRERRHNWL